MENSPAQFQWSQYDLWWARHNCDGQIVTNSDPSQFIMMDFCDGFLPVTNILWRTLWRNIPNCGRNYDGKFRNNFRQMVALEEIAWRLWRNPSQIVTDFVTGPSQFLTEFHHNFSHYEDLCWKIVTEFRHNFVFVTDIRHNFVSTQKKNSCSSIVQPVNSFFFPPHLKKEQTNIWTPMNKIKIGE